MIRNLKFPLVFLILAAIVIYLLKSLELISAITCDSIAYACIISFINFIIFIGLVEFSIKKSNKTFLLYNLGGMPVRMVIMLVLVFLTIKFLKIDEFKFIFAFFLLYVLFLVYEINIIRLKVEKPLKASKNTENVVQ